MRESWQHFYATGFWQRRRKLQLQMHPLCKYCARDGIVTPASHVDHVKPHKGNWNLFALGELQSLCANCHNQRKQHEERIGFDIMVDDDGWPTDPNHPANRHR